MRHLITDARLAFPALFAPQVSDDGNSSYGALLIIEPTNPIVATLRKSFEIVAKEKWGAKGEAILKQIIAQDRTALHDGNLKAQYAGFENMLFVSARSQIKPSVFDRNKEELLASSGKPYAGCYVNASIELYAQDNKFGKRINAQLRGVQYVRDGDSFAAGSAAKDDEFQDLGDQGADTDPTA